MPTAYESLKSQRQGLESCQLIASNKSNSSRKADLILKRDFQVITFFIPLEVGYLVIIAASFFYK